MCKPCKKTSGAMVLASSKRRNWPFKILDRESGMNKSRHPTKKQSFLAQKPRHEQTIHRNKGSPRTQKQTADIENLQFLNEGKELDFM